MATQKLSPAARYLELFEIAGVGGPPKTITPDAETTDPAAVGATRRFEPQGARCVEIYWEGDEVQAGATASFTFLKYDGSPTAPTYIIAARVADVPIKTSVIVPTGLASHMAVLLTGMTNTQADAVRVHAAQAFEVYA